MIELAHSKMPNACFYEGDFSQGLVPELCGRKYDAIVATYSLHHLTDEQKVAFIRTLLPLLKEGGRLLIGDVAFETRDALDRCKTQAGEEWDDEEIYFVYDELKPHFPAMTFTRFSDCAGLLELAA